MDAIFMGEMLIDFTPGNERNSYVRNPGGAPANAAISMRRNGLEVGFLGKMGNDDFGRFLLQTLQQEKVNVLCPDLTEEAMTTMAFVTLYDNGERSFSFARKPGADMLLSVKDVKEADIQASRLLHAGSVSLSAEPSGEATRYGMKLAHDLGKLVSFDVNYREMIWGKEEAKVQIDRILPYVDLLKISDEELYFLGGEEQIPAQMKQYGISVVIETLGARGAKYYFKDKSLTVEGRSVTAVDATGAGDAFWGSFLSSLLMSGISKREELDESSIALAVRYGNAAGSLCVQKMGGIPALPYREDIEEIL